MVFSPPPRTYGDIAMPFFISSVVFNNYFLHPAGCVKAVRCFLGECVGGNTDGYDITSVGVLKK